MSCFENPCNLKTNSEKLMKRNICQLILSTFKNLPSDPKVTRAACGAVFSLALLEENRTRLFDEGLIHALLLAMQNHLGVEKVQEYCVGTIWTLGYSFAMVRLNAVRLIVAACERHQNNQRIAEYACGAFKGFTDLPMNAQILIDEDGPACLTKIIDLHLTNSGLVSVALTALWSLSIHQDSKVELINRGCGDFLLNLLRDKHRAYQPGYDKVLANIYGILTSLGKSRDAAGSLIDNGAIAKIADSAQMLISNENVVLRALSAIANLGYVEDENKGTLRSPNCQRFIQSALDSFPENRKVLSKTGFIKELIERATS
eukprot:maker-scaffold_25-snap-gene-0.38-mRNA-1 protein AED:0.02 eAED:0.02 QI:833/1/1/1/0.5/0.4/5/121/315